MLAPRAESLAIPTALLLSVSPLGVFALAGLLVMQETMLQIRVIEGEGAVNAVGTRGPGLTLEITDEIGRPVAGAIISVRLPDEGPTGAFSSGLASEIVTAGADGRAATSPIRWNRLAGAFQIRVTVAKDRLRAGTVVSQQLVEGIAKRSGTPAPAARSFRRKWLPIALIAAGAVGGFAVGMASRGGSEPAPPVAGVQIGPPSITITKP